jgi:hypothetical protein
MSKHEELIKSLRASAAAMPFDAAVAVQYRAAADALEAQAREIEGLQEQLASNAKSAFEAMPHDIPQRMKRKICVETGWSMSMVSRAYIELRAAFTGEKYTANEDLDAARAEIEGLHAARRAYASEFPQDSEGEPDVGSIHQNIRAMKAEIEGLRLKADRYDYLTLQHGEYCVADASTAGAIFKGSAADQLIDAAKGAPHG